LHVGDLFGGQRPDSTDQVMLNRPKTSGHDQPWQTALQNTIAAYLEGVVGLGVGRKLHCVGKSIGKTFGRLQVVID